MVKDRRIDETTRADDEAALTRRILAALSGLRFGSVELTVHDGRVVQLDRRERIRIENPPRRD